jgi:predicted nucleic acid-binding protein
MDIIVDTDILSTFGKTNKYALLKNLFPKSKLFISPKVYQDIIKAKDMGYDFVERILKHKPLICPLTEDEIKHAGELKDKERYLGWGEIESIILAKNRSFLLLTNDKKAIRIAHKLDINYFNLPMLLRQFWKQALLSKEEVLKLILVIEEKDRILILNKNKIFEE